MITSASQFAHLTFCEREAVEAYLGTGMVKTAAAVIGIGVKSFSGRIESARRKTGHKNIVLLSIAYDRAARGWA